MVLPVLFLLLMFQSDDAPVGGTAGIKITLLANEKSSDPIVETTYLLRDRSRYEMRHKDGTRIQGADDVVKRCDLREVMYFSPDYLTYYAQPYPPARITDADAKAFGLRTTPNVRTVEPIERIETTYQDTGERKEVFGFEARHIIMTKRDTPLQAGRLPTTEVVDGWFINLERRTSCERRYDIESRNDPPIYPNWTVDNIERVVTGDVPDSTESWVPVELQTISWQTQALPDGATREVVAGRSTLRLTSIEEMILDPALFGPPAGYAIVKR